MSQLLIPDDISLFSDLISTIGTNPGNIYLVFALPLGITITPPIRGRSIRVSTSKRTYTQAQFFFSILYINYILVY
jgi:hypothetical protein